MKIILASMISRLVRRGNLKFSYPDGETRTFGLAPGAFEVRTAVAPQVMGRPSADIAIAVDKVSVFPNDGRELGVAFGTAEITR